MTDEVKGTIQPDEFSFKWRIQRFFTDSQEVGVSYDSPVFAMQYVGKIIKWHLTVYPRGDEEHSKDYASLYLFLDCGDASEVTVDFQCSIITAELQDSVNIKKQNACRFRGASQGWGWSQFAEQYDINRPGVMIDDTLTFLCEVTFHPTAQDAMDGFRGYDELLDKIDKEFGDYEDLLESGNFTDVTFNVPDKKISSHKAILSHRSPVFKAMFQHDMQEKQRNSVDVVDVEHDVMKELFRFIYSGRVKKIDKIAGDLLVAADKYQVIELKALCEKTLYDKLAVGNAVKLLKISEMCETIHLKRLLVKFVAEHYREIVKRPGFADLSSKVMHQIMRVIAEKD